MARSPRSDTPGSRHHVMNRGVARRTLFENIADIRFFLSRLAREVRAGNIEVHAFCILTTHFHLLLRSPVGELSGAMRRVQLSHVRRFNRTRRRDGPLVRGRFRSRLVDSLSYRFILVRYIDANSVKAGLCEDPVDYPHGSARWYGRLRGPPWLQRGWVESVVRGHLGHESYQPDGYSAVFKGEIQSDEYLVCHRMANPRAPDHLDDLLLAAPPAVLAWMRRKALLADGTRPGSAVVDPQSVRAAIARSQATHPTWRVRLTQKSRDAWLVAAIGLLRDLCGVSWVEAAALVGRSDSNVANLYRAHRRLLGEDDAYAARVSQVAHSALGVVSATLEAIRLAVAGS